MYLLTAGPIHRADDYPTDVDSLLEWRVNESVAFFGQNLRPHRRVCLRRRLRSDATRLLLVHLEKGNINQSINQFICRKANYLSLDVPVVCVRHVLRALLPEKSSHGIQLAQSSVRHHNRQYYY